MFLPAIEFSGSKDGFAFKTGEFGLGYYADGSDCGGDYAKHGFDVRTCKLYVQHGYTPLTPDSGVLKKVLRHAKCTGSYSVPTEGCPCSVQYVGRICEWDTADGDCGGEYASESESRAPLGEGAIFETTRDLVGGKHVGGTDDPFEFQLKRGKWIKGCDVGVGTMQTGELASFIIRHEYAYGAQGLPPKVLPGASVEIEIELLSYGESVPRFPSKAELDEGRRRREQEEQEQAKANPPPTIVDRIEGSTAAKEKANALFREGKYEEARKEYDSAFIHIFVTKEEWEGFMPDAEKAQIQAQKLPLHLNRAMCKLKLGKIEDAMWDCDKAIALAEEQGVSCVKGHFRRGLVFTEKVDAELRKEDAGEFWDVDKGKRFLDEARSSLNEALALQPHDAAVKKAVRALASRDAKLKQCEANYREQQKKLFRDRMIGSLDAQHREQEQREKQVETARQQEAEAAMYDDMPALDEEDE